MSSGLLLCASLLSVTPTLLWAPPALTGPKYNLFFLAPWESSMAFLLVRICILEKFWVPAITSVLLLKTQQMHQRNKAACRILGSPQRISVLSQIVAPQFLDTPKVLQCLKIYFKLFYTAFQVTFGESVGLWKLFYFYCK